MIQMIIEILQAFFVKIMDNGLSTFKSIYQNKEKYIISALFASASQFFYLVGVKQVASGSGYVIISVMTFATFIGTLLPGIFMKKIEKDKPWTFEITASSFDKGIEFADELRKLDLDVKTTVSYDTEVIKVISCKVKCSTKEHSRKVMKLLPDDFEYEVTVPLQF